MYTLDLTNSKICLLFDELHVVMRGLVRQLESRPTLHSGPRTQRQVGDTAFNPDPCTTQLNLFACFAFFPTHGFDCYQDAVINTLLSTCFWLPAEGQAHCAPSDDDQAG